MFVKTYSEYERSQVNTVDIFFVAEQLAAFSATYGKKIVERYDNEDIISIVQLTNEASEALSYNNKTITKVFDVMLDFGLMKGFMKKTNEPFFRASDLNKLKWFSQFVKYKGTVEIEKMLSEHLSLKQRRSIYLLYEYAKNRGVAIDQNVNFELKELSENYGRIVNFNFSQEAIEKAAKIGLVMLEEGKFNIKTVNYNPLELSRSIVSLNVLIALKKVQDEMHKVAYRQVS